MPAASDEKRQEPTRNERGSDDVQHFRNCEVFPTCVQKQGAKTKLRDCGDVPGKAQRTHRELRAAKELWQVRPTEQARKDVPLTEYRMGYAKSDGEKCCEVKKCCHSRLPIEGLNNAPTARENNVA